MARLTQMEGGTGRIRRGRLLGALLFLAIGAMATATHAQGIFLPSIGPVNQSMGGAATAAPIDSAGAMSWNPATISGLKSNEMAFGLGLVIPRAIVSSQIVTSGSTDSDAGAMPIPSISWVHKPNDSAWTFGMGIFAVGGFGVNYPASTTNPILSPQAVGGVGGLGRNYSSAEIYQIVPTASYALNDKLSIGFSPMVTMAKIALDPLFLAPPDATGIYGPGTASRFSYGGGFQTGIYYITDYNWHLGASVKSPQWMEAFRFNSQDSTGLPVMAKAYFNLPTTVSLGTAYDGFNRWLFATDVRYFDYGNADGFSQSGFNPNLSVAGLGWRSIWSVSTGAEYEATSRLKLRTGYQFIQNPVPDSKSMFNIPSALIIQNWYSLGGSFQLARNVTANLAWTHGFENTGSGPVVNPVLGTLAGTSVTNRISTDILNAGVTVTY